jgi:hypothetical protein
MAELPDFAIELISDRIVDQYPDLSEKRSQLPEIVRYTIGLIETMTHLAGGDPTGMIRRGPNGEIAERVVEAGIPCWEIRLNGNISYNHEPTLPWGILYQPPLEADPPTDPPITEETP